MNLLFFISTYNLNLINSQYNWLVNSPFTETPSLTLKDVIYIGSNDGAKAYDVGCRIVYNSFKEMLIKEVP